MKDNAYFESAQAVGSPPWRTVLRHVLPNVLAPIIVIFSITVGTVIITEASLSFLGLGLPLSVPSWGGLLSREGRNYMQQAPWLAMWSGIFPTIVVYMAGGLFPRPRQALLPIFGATVGVSHSDNYQSSRLDTVDETVGIAAEQEAPGAMIVGGPSVRCLRNRQHRRLELEYEAGRGSGTALRIPASSLLCLDQSVVEILKFPRHDQRRQESGGAPPPTGQSWLSRHLAGAGAAESRPTTPLRHLRRSVGRGSRSTAQRARHVPRRRAGVPR